MVLFLHGYYEVGDLKFFQDNGNYDWEAPNFWFSLLSATNPQDSIGNFWNSTLLV